MAAIPKRQLFDTRTFNADLFSRASPAFRFSVIQKGERNVTKSRALSRLIDSFEIEEDDRMATIATINFDNPEFRLSRQDSLLQPGTLLVLEIGHGLNLSGSERAIEIVRLLPDFPRDGKPKFSVQGYDARQRMLDTNTLSDRGIDKPDAAALRAKLSGTFKNKTLNQTLQQIAKAFGFELNIGEKFVALKDRKTRIKKKDQTWWDFLLKLAEKFDAEVWVDYTFTSIVSENKWVLWFQPRNRFGKADLKLSYGLNGTGTLLTLKPKLDPVGQQTSVQVLSFDRRKRLTRIAYILDRKDREAGLTQRFNEFIGALVKIKVSGKVTHIFNTGRPFKTKKEAQQFAENHVLRNREDFITATGTTIGIPQLRPRQIHELVTGDKRFDGKYYFTQVKHRFPDRGVYECDFVAYKVPTQFVVPKPAQKTIGFEFQGEDIEGARFQPFRNFGDDTIII
jgi:hypothetical protein